MDVVAAIPIWADCLVAGLWRGRIVTNPATQSTRGFCHLTRKYFARSFFTGPTL
jgi:hypothetical protein